MPGNEKKCETPKASRRPDVEPPALEPTDQAQKKNPATGRNNGGPLYESLVTEMLSGFALHEIIRDDSGTPADYRFLEVNPAFEKITGLKSEAVVGKTIVDLYPYIERQLLGTYGRVMLEDKPIFIVYYSKRLEKWLEVHAYSPEKGKFVTLFRDISETVNAKHALEESEKRLREVIERSLDGFVRKDLSGRILEVNKAFCDIVGYTVEELKRRNRPSINPGKWNDMRKTMTEQLLRHGHTPLWEKEYRKKGGAIVPVEVRSYLKKSYNGEPLEKWAFVRDISERKWAEKALQDAHNFLEFQVKQRTDELTKANARLQAEIAERRRTEKALRIAKENMETMLNSLGDGICLIDGDFNMVYTNPVLENDLGPAEGKKCYDYYGGLTKACPNCRLHEVLSGKTVRREDYSPITDKTYEMIDTVFKKPDGSRYMIAIARDITARKADEDKIITALKEKEMLLREIHHRVKNNIQVIASLIKLQCAKVEDAHYSDLYRGTLDRIKSMALVHEKLYRSDDFSRISLKEYIEDLTRKLFESHGVDRSRIRFWVDGDMAIPELNSAICLGLIVNELITNSLKYAFPDNQRGEIRVTLRSAAAGEIGIEVSDDGIGMPQGVDFDNGDTLGLQIVKALGELQLGGKIDLDTTRGTAVRIQLKLASE